MALYEIENVKFRYPGSTTDVLTGVSLELKEGEILSILGPNGAGKSTLLDCMAGLQVPTGGSIRLNGCVVSDLKPKEIARLVSYVPQTHVPAFGYTVLDFAIMGRASRMGMFQKPGERDIQVGYETLCQLGIEHLAHKPYTEISGGERQQAIIARALCQQPKIILFDEPTAHLDYGNQYRILELIKELSAQGFAIVNTTHNPDHALLLGDNAAIIDCGGKIQHGPCEKILTEERLRGLYHIELRMANVPEVGRNVCLTPKLEAKEKREV